MSEPDAPPSVRARVAEMHEMAWETEDDVLYAARCSCGLHADKPMGDRGAYQWWVEHAVSALRAECAGLTRMVDHEKGVSAMWLEKYNGMRQALATLADETEKTEKGLRASLAAVTADTQRLDAITKRLTLSTVIEMESWGDHFSVTIDIAISTDVSADVEETGAITVPAKKLFEIAREPPLPASEPEKPT